MANEPQRDITAEEREQFERKELHHEDEDAAGGPAGEHDVATPPVPPDAGAIKR